MLIYIHGFASSSNSKKCQELKAFYDDEIISMDLSCEPLKAIKELKVLIKKYENEDLILLGSSLGGYYALHLLQTFDLPVVLVNPSMQPFQTLARFANKDVANYSKDQSCFFKAEYVEQLKAMDITIKDQSKVLLLLQTGDENLDYKVALWMLPEAKSIVQEGGNHAFEDFKDVFGEIRSFYQSCYG